MIRLWLRIAAPIAAPVPMSMPPSPVTITKVMSSPSGQLAAALPLVEHLDEAAERRRAVLEEVVDVRDAVRRVRVAGADDHRAAGLVEDDDVALDALQELVERREDAAAGARAVAGGDALRLRDELPRGRRLDAQPAVSAVGATWMRPLRRVRLRERRQARAGAAGCVGSPGTTP